MCDRSASDYATRPGDPGYAGCGCGGACRFHCRLSRDGKGGRVAEFKHDLSPEAPICRWVLQGVALDLMPSQPGILGFHSRWYPLAIETAAQIKLNGIDIRLITAPVFVATKFEAFHGRGNNDYLGSHDLEDIITVVDGRLELQQEIDQADGELRRYIVAEFNALLEDRDFLMALAGHLPGDAASQARLPELISRMRAIGKMRQE